MTVQKRGSVKPPDPENEKDYRNWWGPHDKGAAKPAFCYQRRVDNLREEVRSMERNLDMGYVSAERKMAYETRLKERKTRLDSIDAETSRVRKSLGKNKDYWVERRKELGEQIASAMPSRNDVEKRRVNPYKVAKMEKEGLGDMKKEYIVISRALGEESNISFLERD
jgi:hypothetical protein